MPPTYQTGEKSQVVSRLEKDLMVGRGRWIADFTESFRDFQVNDVVFDAFVRGNTRSSGFLLSRLYSFFLNPNYEVACYILQLHNESAIEQKLLRKCMIAVKDSMRTNEIKWAWLYVLGKQLDSATVDYVKSFKDQSIGLVCALPLVKKIISNETFLGRQARKFLKL